MKKLIGRCVSLVVALTMIFVSNATMFALEPVRDIPINIEDVVSNPEEESSEGETESQIENVETETIVETIKEEEFTTHPFPWTNIMVDEYGKVLPSSRAVQAVIECNWMKYKNPALASMGEIPWILVTIGGKVAYCVDTLNPNTNSGVSFVQKTDYTKLSDGQRDTIAYIMRYGSKSVATDTNNILSHMATQALIWEVVDGERAPYTLAGASGGVYQDLVKRYPDIAVKYNAIIGNAKSWSEIPSFTDRFKGSAPTYKLDGTGPYTTTIENTNANCDLSKFAFDFDGVTANVSGSSLTITSNAEITTPMTLKTDRKDVTKGETYIFWFDPTGKDQTRMRPGIDPVPAYFKLSTDEESVGPGPTPDEEYEIIINKYQKGTNIPLGGAQFSVKYLGGSGDIVIIPPKEPGVPEVDEDIELPEKHFETTVTTDESGTIKVKVPYKGIYEIKEIAPPANHKLDENFLQTIVVNEDVTSVSVDFHNEPFTGVRIKKIDAQTKVALSGATFRLEQIDGGIVRTGISGGDGIVYFENLPAASYRVTEITPPPNYHLAEIPIQTVELLPNQTATLIFEDEPFSGFKIRKVDAHTGVGLAGGVFTIEVKDGELIGEYITDINGLITKDDLPQGWYTITEIQAPDGYLIDEENAVKDIYIRPEDDVEVVFRDFKKPQLELQKIDEKTGEPLAGAVFKVAVKDSVIYTEVTTGIDGIAHLEGA